MVLILETCVILDLRVASDALLGQRANAALVVLNASVHNDIGLIRNAVDSILAQRDVVALHFCTRAFANFDARALHVGDCES